MQRFLYYRGERLMAVRAGAFKAHFYTQAGYGPGSDTPQAHDPPLLYQLEHDPSEQFNVAERHPEVLREIARIVEEHRRDLVPGAPQLDAVIARSP